MSVALLIPLALAIVIYAVVLAREAIARRAVPTGEALLLGAVVNFFDTFGIGSFAQTTAWMKFRKMVPDRLIPPTMLVGHGPPTMAQGFIFLALLGKQMGVTPDGWREAAGVYGEAGSTRSIADVTSAEALAAVRAYKQKVKAKAKAVAAR